MAQPRDNSTAVCSEPHPPLGPPVRAFAWQQCGVQFCSHDSHFVEYMARRTVAGPIPHLRLYFTALNARLPRSNRVAVRSVDRAFPVNLTAGRTSFEVACRGMAALAAPEGIADLDTADDGSAGMGRVVGAARFLRTR